MLDSATVNAAGKGVATFPTWVEHCLPDPGGSPNPQVAACFDRLAQEGYQQEVVAHPGSHSGPCSGETGVLLGLTALLGGFCFWWLRRLSRLGPGEEGSIAEPLRHPPGRHRRTGSPHQRHRLDRSPSAGEGAQVLADPARLSRRPSHADMQGFKDFTDFTDFAEGKDTRKAR
ncbi:hypothetical protein [Nocardioides insulae]|uniref:hypothetical protein n=1 Tax=Nocardioides insulae TaxID=394734 RepID=UPI00041519BC|nr:hypothetical protein [Nocardioides insulae]